MKEAWVLQLKEESKEEYMLAEHYYCDENDGDFLTEVLNDATIFYDKEQAISEMKEYERLMIEKFGEDAIVNVGHTNMMKHFNFVEVEIEEVD